MSKPARFLVNLRWWKMPPSTMCPSDPNARPEELHDDVDRHGYASQITVCALLLIFSGGSIFATAYAEIFESTSLGASAPGSDILQILPYLIVPGVVFTLLPIRVATVFAEHLCGQLGSRRFTAEFLVAMVAANLLAWAMDDFLISPWDYVSRNEDLLMYFRLGVALSALFYWWIAKGLQIGYSLRQLLEPENFVEQFAILWAPPAELYQGRA